MIDTIRYAVALLRTDRRGVTAVEYGIMAALIATVLVSALSIFTPAVTTAFTNIAGHLSSGK